GLFDIEIFKADGRYLFNEMNWRNSAVCFAAAASGVNYPVYWYCAVTGNDYQIHKPDTYGVYAINELLDFHHVTAGEVSLGQWLKDLKNSKAKAYYSKTDRKPMNRRLAMFVENRIPFRNK
ncbi:MAG: hypothetical protein K6A40_10895, partial [Solobacterium sp.]|nr:hypothetical protein [Solobacterium sp.]